LPYVLFRLKNISETIHFLDWFWDTFDGASVHRKASTYTRKQNIKVRTYIYSQSWIRTRDSTVRAATDRAVAITGRKVSLKNYWSHHDQGKVFTPEMGKVKSLCATVDNRLTISSASRSNPTQYINDVCLLVYSTTLYHMRDNAEWILIDVGGSSPFLFKELS
jgi:hypothetical protein